MHSAWCSRLPVNKCQRDRKLTQCSPFCQMLKSSASNTKKGDFFAQGMPLGNIHVIAATPRMCTDCKAHWGTFVICDIGLYKCNWIELNWTSCHGKCWKTLCVGKVSCELKHCISVISGSCPAAWGASRCRPGTVTPQTHRRQISPQINNSQIN